LRLDVDHLAADLLCQIGNADDAALLCTAAAASKSLRPYAARIARRLAPRLRVRDLGQVALRLGTQPLARPVRRKVLALLCYLITRPRMAATRDEAIEAIWPDLGPDTAANSLHQTIYFLRRVLEPDYKDWRSAGYVAFDGEVLALDGDLAEADSRRCWQLVREAQLGDSSSLDELVDLYEGSFALDFAYEEWSGHYRDTLHAAVLATCETGIRSAIDRGEIDTAISLAQRMLVVDPRADAIEYELLRAYKTGNRHAAAAEQYAHYASFLRNELAAEPAPLSDI
jgi:DNA-binding SARP family transcriptional activator